MSYSRKTKGQSLAEYGLILALIAVVCVGMLSSIGRSLLEKLTRVNTCISSSTGGC